MAEKGEETPIQTVSDLMCSLDLSPEACKARIEARSLPFKDVITFDEKHQTFELAWPGNYTYSISINGVSSSAGLVGWLAHLVEKSWVTPLHIAGLIALVDIHVGLYRLRDGVTGARKDRRRHA